MNKILIALDYEADAIKVAKKGFLLAKAMGAKVVLLHVIDENSYFSILGYSPINGFSGFLDMSPMKSESSEELNITIIQFLEKIKQQLGDETIQSHIKEGNFAESILMEAEEIKAGIIVLGSHSQKWLENIVMGSLTEKVLNNISIPVFIVPTKQIS